MILVTGSAGLIGRRIVAILRDAGAAVREFDIRRCPAQDTRDPDALAGALDGTTGVVHLAAVSRVVWAQRDPELTEAVNVAPLRQITAHIRKTPTPPWLIFASSREVYGQSEHLPVHEEAALDPLNIYARSKAAGEMLVRSLASDGHVSNICRFSNVYGCVDDHPDRVVPAFARAAAERGSIRIEGADNVFDFTHVDDAARGLKLAIDAAGAGRKLPPIHFVTGRPCSLGELADLAVRYSHAAPRKYDAPSRDYDVATFYGDPQRADALLGWRSEISIEQGLGMLIAQFRETILEPSDISPVLAAHEGISRSLGA